MTTTATTRGRDDSGFTLIEVIVAMALFAVVSSITLGLLVQTTGVTRNNLRRTTAANLGSAQIEAVRTSAATMIPSGTSTSTKTVGGVVYTITQTAKFVASGSSVSICEGGGTSLAYKLVTISVTWPAMGNVKPIRLDTLKSVSLGSKAGELDTSLGTLAVAVAGASGAVEPGVAVTAVSGSTTQTVTSGDDGCVVFSGLPPGTYTVSANVPGFSGTNNTQLASVGSLGVTAGGLTRTTLSYDEAGSIAYTFDTPAGTVVPATLPIRVGGTYRTEYTLGACPGTVVAGCVSALTGMIRGLFPDNWTVKVGACQETTPSKTAIDLRLLTSTGNAVIPMGAPAVTVRMTVGGAPATARTVMFTHASQAGGCSPGESYSITSSGSATPVTVAIPYGTWTVTTTGLALGTSVTLGPANKTPAITLSVTL